MTIRLLLSAYGGGGTGIAIYGTTLDSNNTWTSSWNTTFSPGQTDTAAQIAAAAEAAMLSFLAGQGMPTPDSVEWIITPQPPAAPSFANPSRSLNTAFQVSTTRTALVSYSVETVCTASLAGGQTGTVFLEYADDSAFTTNVKEVGRSVNGNSVSLAIALTAVQTVATSMSGMIPAGKYVRLRTANTVGTPTFTFRSAQEVLV